MGLNAEPGPSIKPIPWEKYVADVRALYLATAGAGPAAMQTWTKAWCEWMQSAAKTHDQIARGWNRIIEDPGQGPALLDQMREDVKQYILELGGIPERAVVEFLQAVSERRGPMGAVRSAPEAFVAAADAVVTAAADAFNQVAQMTEAPPTTKGRPTRPPAAPDPLAELRQRMTHLQNARTRLGSGPE